MGTAIGELLPLAVAIAISVTTIIATVLMLLSPKAKRRTVGLLVGCVVGVGGAVALFTLLADLLPTQDSGGSSLLASVIKMVVGVLLVVLALREWRERPTSGDRAELPKWMAGVDSMMPGKALVLGLLLSAVVPKNLLLALSAGVIVGEAGFGIGRAAVVIVCSRRSPFRPSRYRLSPISWRRSECAGRSRGYGSGWSTIMWRSWLCFCS